MALHFETAGRIRHQTIAVLELLVAQARNLLPYQLELTRQSALRHALDELAREWRTTPENLADTLTSAGDALERLIRRRRVWRDPAEVLDAPNVAAILALAEARAARIVNVVRRRPLEQVCRKLRRALDQQSCRQRIEQFLAEPPPPDDWIDQYVARLSRKP